MTRRTWHRKRVVAWISIGVCFAILAAEAVASAVGKVPHAALGVSASFTGLTGIVAGLAYLRSTGGRRD